MNLVLKRKRILLVDDNDEHLFLMNQALSGHGFENVISVQSGPEALQVLANKRIDAILLDVIMPHMNGVEVCKAIRSGTQVPDTPIIFISNEYDEKMIDQCFEVGGTGFIRKPFEGGQIASKLLTVFSLNSLCKKLKTDLGRTTEKVQAIVDLIENSDSIAHDFLGVLSAMTGLVDQMRATIPRGLKSWEISERIFKASRRSEELAEKLLQHSEAIKNLKDFSAIKDSLPIKPSKPA